MDRMSAQSAFSLRQIDVNVNVKYIEHKVPVIRELGNEWR